MSDVHIIEFDANDVLNTESRTLITTPQLTDVLGSLLAATVGDRPYDTTGSGG